MSQCKLHSISIYDHNDTFQEVLYFENIIFKIGCAKSGHKYISHNGKLFDTTKYHITELDESDTLENMHYKAIPYKFELQIDSSNRELFMTSFNSVTNYWNNYIYPTCPHKCGKFEYPLSLYNNGNANNFLLSKDSSNCIDPSVHDNSLSLNINGDILGSIALKSELSIKMDDWSRYYKDKKNDQKDIFQTDLIEFRYDTNNRVEFYHQKTHPGTNRVATRTSFENIPFDISKNNNTYTMILKYDPSSTIGYCYNPPEKECAEFYIGNHPVFPTPTPPTPGPAPSPPIPTPPTPSI